MTAPKLISSIAIALNLFAAPGAWAQSSSAPQAQTQPGPPTLRIYGFAQADAIADFKQNDPNWFDVARPSRLPSVPNQFGQDGRFYLTARQTRFGFDGTLPTSDGDVKAVLEFDMFGVGPDAGQTTLRLRHAYGQWKRIGAGQTNSQFMDQDVFPNILYYWSPNGMLLLRNPQVFWQPYLQGGSNLTVAIERPGASGDFGTYADHVELSSDVTPRFRMPDITGHYRLARKWGYAQVGGIVRYIGYDDNNASDQIDLSGHVWGWGVSLSSNVNVTARDRLRLQTVFGAGVQNYVNDAPIDVAAKSNPGDPRRPVIGEALPLVTVVAYVDHKWTDRWSTSAGYSSVNESNSDGQRPSAFRAGQYASVNLLCTPVENFVAGGEFQWARRANNSDGFSVNDYRLEFSFRYRFDYRLAGQ